MICDLDYLESVIEGKMLSGGIYASAGGTTGASYGFGYASTGALAIAPQTSTSTNTFVQTYLGSSGYSLTLSNGTASAYAANNQSYAQANYFSSSSFAGFIGSSMNTSLTTVSGRIVNG